jgi:Protein of unknown function (DUF4232)
MRLRMQLMRLRLQQTRRAIARAARCATTAIVLAAAVTACGSMSTTGDGTGAQAGTGTQASNGTQASPGASAPASAGASTGTGTAGCAASSLRVTLDIHAAGAAAGSSFLPLDFTNISRSTCRLTGYPVVSFASGVSGRPVGTAAALDRSVRARPVALAPGATAHAWLQVIDATNFPAKQCHPVAADGLRINLPGQRADSYVSHAFAACAAAMHGSEILTVQPIQPGRARRGTAQ